MTHTSPAADPGRFAPVAAVDPTTAISWLFVPGSRPDRFAKAHSSGAHMVIYDLEDSVPAAEKDTARRHVRHWLGNADQQILAAACLRINAPGTRWYEQDLAAGAAIRGLSAIMLPKTEDAATIEQVLQAVGDTVPVVALIETARGVQAVDDIAATAGVSRLAFGSVDFALDISAEEDADVLHQVRGRLVVASRAQNLPAPLDGVTRDVADPDATRHDARRARRNGFGGKLCIHPRQVGPTHQGFQPSAAELAAAQRIVAASPDGAAVELDGQMIDEPVVAKARRLILTFDPTASRRTS
jgi:citrate lyase subunit beta/citryl-CoA lyase